MKRAKLPIILLVMVFLTSSVFAQPFMKGMRGKGLRKHSPERIYFILKAKQKELNVTDSQLEKIKNLVFSFEEKMITAKNEISKNRLGLKKLLMDEEELNYGRIKAILTEMSNYKQNIFIERLKLRKAIKDILTPEQHDALKRMVEERLKERRFFLKGKSKFSHWFSSNQD